MTEDRGRKKGNHRRRAALIVLAALVLSAGFAAFCFVSWVFRPIPPSLSGTGARVHQYQRDSALALLDGHALARFDQMDERLFLRLFIETMDEPFDTVALGSSRILQLTAQTVGSGSFYNFGVSGADYRDVMTTYYRLEMAGMLPKNLIIGLDPWLLRGDGEALHAKSDDALFEAFTALCLADGTDTAPPALATAEGPQSALAENAEPAEPVLRKLADNTTCLKNLDFFATGVWQPTPPLLAEGDVLTQPTQLKMPDGSALYSQRFRALAPDEIQQLALQEAVTFLHMDGFSGPDARLSDLFTAFVQRAQKQGVNVIFLMAPYHPTVYRYASENSENYPGFFLTEAWYTALARQCGVPVYGSYNPFVTGNGPQDFYDGLHIRRECLPDVFPGLDAVLAAQKNGSAQSPWMNGRERVQEPVAQQLVVEYYVIEAPHYLVLDGNQEVMGHASYVYHRYNTDNEGVLYARYAVSVDEGVVWRSDDDAGWVVDPRFTV